MKTATLNLGLDPIALVATVRPTSSAGLCVDQPPFPAPWGGTAGRLGVAKGLLLPRLTQAQVAAIARPAAGLTIFNTSTNRLGTWNGHGWDQALSATETPVSAGSQTFGVPGQHTYIVPVGIVSLDVSGGRGGNDAGGTQGGGGMRVLTMLRVPPGETLLLTLGGAGTMVPFSSTGGWGFNGGGRTGVNGTGGSTASSTGSGGGGCLRGGPGDKRRGGGGEWDKSLPKCAGSQRLAGI